MAKRAEARYVISADDQTARGTDSAERNFQRLRGSLAGFRTFAVAAGAAAATAITAIATAAADSAQRLDDLAKQGRDFELSPDLTRALRFAAERAGVDEGRFFQALRQVNRVIDEAIEGNKEYAESLRSIGIEARDLRGLGPVERLAAALTGLRAAQLAGQDVSSEQARILGRGPGAGQLINFGAQGLVQAFELFRNLAAPLNQAARTAEDSQDAAAEFNLAFGSLWDYLLEEAVRIRALGLRRAAEFVGGINQFYRDLNAPEAPSLPTAPTIADRVQSEQLTVLKSIDGGIRDMDLTARYR